MFFKGFCQEKMIFPRSSRNSDFSHGDWAGGFGALQRQSQLASESTLSPCVVWSCMRRCSAQEWKRLPMARRACASTHEMCFSHSVMFRCHSPMVVRSLTRWSLENFGAIFNGSGILRWHPCSDLVLEGWQSSFRLPGCHHLAKASDCWGRRGDSGGGQQQRTWAGVLSLRPHVEVWHVQRQHAQRSGSRTWSSSRRSGRGEVETLQFDRGGSDAERRGGVDVEWATCLATRMFVTCRDVLSPCAIVPGLSLLQRARPGVLPCRPRAPREAARLNRVRITPVRVLLPKRQEKWLNHFGTLAVKAVVVDSHTELGGLACPTPSCTPQWRFWQHSTWQCSIPGWAWAFGSSPVLWRRCCWSNVSLLCQETFTCLGWTKSNRVFVTFVSMLVDSFSWQRIVLSEILKTNHLFLFPKRTTFFICVEDCIAWLEALVHLRSDVSDLFRGTSVASSRVFFFFALKKRTRGRHKKKKLSRKKGNWTKKILRKVEKHFSETK